MCRDAARLWSLPLVHQPIALSLASVENDITSSGLWSWNSTSCHLHIHRTTPMNSSSTPRRQPAELDLTVRSEITKSSTTTRSGKPSELISATAHSSASSYGTYHASWWPPL